ncbi:hypothetical protein LMG28138_05872 [Pararobbsia alpina]|uniref:Uncharacterized protein n=1 Tax=Pararobbsia alpina TaxID=621374 RepID=A0A6S7BN92_9BURK|nr:hypothetical protein LMG28138_05872 [Pararobbsia alpina]
MKKLQVQADALIARKAQAAVDQIRALMLEHGLTIVDVEVEAKAKREAKAANGSVPNVKAKASSNLKGGTAPNINILKQVPPGLAMVARRNGLLKRRTEGSS